MLAAAAAAAAAARHKGSCILPEKAVGVDTSFWPLYLAA
jgi:hypothetical protein